MLAWLRQPRWSPYLVGALLGALLWFIFSIPQKTLGVSTNFSQAVRLAEEAIAPSHAAQLTYFADYKIPRLLGWETGILIGTVLGAWAAALLGASFLTGRLPELWVERFGPSRLQAYSLAILGGLFVGYGARLAGGCTSGHGISGTLQLAVSSWAFFIAVFAAGLATAALLFRKEA